MVLSSTGLLRAGYFAGSISEEIKEQINCEVVFRIPVPFVEGGIPVYESTVVTWIIMAVVTVICALLTRNLKIVPNRKQMILETAVGWVQNFCRNNMGEGGMRYFPYLGTVLIYIGISNKWCSSPEELFSLRKAVPKLKEIAHGNTLNISIKR